MFWPSQLLQTIVLKRGGSKSHFWDRILRSWEASKNSPVRKAHVSTTGMSLQMLFRSWLLRTVRQRLPPSQLCRPLHPDCSFKGWGSFSTLSIRILESGHHNHNQGERRLHLSIALRITPALWSYCLCRPISMLEEEIADMAPKGILRKMKDPKSCDSSSLPRKCDEEMGRRKLRWTSDDWTWSSRSSTILC